MSIHPLHTLYQRIVERCYTVVKRWKAAVDVAGYTTTLVEDLSLCSETYHWRFTATPAGASARSFIILFELCDSEAYDTGQPNCTALALRLVDAATGEHLGTVCPQGDDEPSEWVSLTDTAHIEQRLRAFEGFKPEVLISMLEAHQ